MSTMSLPVLSVAPAAAAPKKKTQVGNYFVANYPPFGSWTQEGIRDLDRVLSEPANPGTDLGLYAHIPFCRKRCHFCYFRVYTDKSSSEVRGYLDTLVAELGRYAAKPVFEGRRPSFVYFGGGTPSYLSPDQFTYLVREMQRHMPWTDAKEIAIEAEPGTLTEKKLKTFRDLGVTRLSLGIEHFDDHILGVNGRAHRSKEIARAYGYAREIGIPQINIDLIAGMLEETDEKWQDAVAKAIALEPDSVTIYQMEIPYNTTIYKQMQAEGSLVAPVADWDTKRAWVSYAFDEFKKAGYSVVAATTVVKDPKEPFLYRKGLFDGTDILSVGVSSFGHIKGVNYQNQHDFHPYLDAVNAGGLPVYRAYALDERERYIREFALQMKNGRVETAPFVQKYGVDPRERFAEPLERLRRMGVLVDTGDALGVNREGLMQVDRLLYEFFLPEHRNGRYA